MALARAPSTVLGALWGFPTGRAVQQVQVAACQGEAAGAQTLEGSGQRGRFQPPVRDA